MSKENDEWYVNYDIAYFEPSEDGGVFANSKKSKIRFDELDNEDILFGI